MKSDHSYFGKITEKGEIKRVDYDKVEVKPILSKEFILNEVWSNFRPDIDWGITDEDEEEIMFCKNEPVLFKNIPMNNNSIRNFFIKLKGNIDNENGEKFNKLTPEERTKVFRIVLLDEESDEFYFINFGSDILGDEVLDNISEYNYFSENK